jgi:hypothetical protein
MFYKVKFAYYGRTCPLIFLYIKIHRIAASIYILNDGSDVAVDKLAYVETVIFTQKDSYNNPENYIHIYRYICMYI